MRLRVAELVCLASLSGAFPTLAAPPAVIEILKAGPPLLLAKPAGRIDQATVLPDRGVLVRDSDFGHPETQALELYDPTGRRTRRIGGFGRSPGQFYRLKDVALTRKGEVWVADIVGRLSFFDLQGKILGTRLIQNPGFQVDGLALDEARGYFYLSGCLPKAVYLDGGCRLVHQFRLADKTYIRSFLETDPEVLEKGLFGLQDSLLSLDDQGRIYAADKPVFKLSRVDPSTGEVRVFPIRSRQVKPVPVVRDPAAARSVYRSSFLVHRVLASGPYVVVSIRRPAQKGFLLEVFTQAGEQVGTDLEVPGTLVGKTRQGDLLFAGRTQRGYELTPYRIRPAGTPRPGGL